MEYHLGNVWPMRTTKCLLSRYSACVGRQNQSFRLSLLYARRYNRQICDASYRVDSRWANSTSVIPSLQYSPASTDLCVQILHLGVFRCFHIISKSFVVFNGVLSLKVKYADSERRAGQVIVKISLMQVHRADPHCYICITTHTNCTAHHLQVRICAQIS
jgi:hypothetical protein